MTIEISGYEIEKDTYSRGEIAEVEVMVDNDECAKVDHVTLDISMKRKLLWFWIPVSKHTEIIHEHIPAHMEKAVGRGIAMPKGLFAKGTYEMTIITTINGNVVGNYVKTVTVN